MGLIDRLKATGLVIVGHKTRQRDSSNKDPTQLLEQGETLEKEGCLQEALANYDKAIQLSPDAGIAHFKRGNILLELGNPKLASEAYECALKLKPDSASAQYNLGRARSFQGLFSDGIEAFEAAIKLKPDFADAYVAMGVSMEDLGRSDDAIEAYRRALEIQPEYAEAHYNLGTLLAKTGKPEGALEELRRAAELKLDYADALGHLGDVLVRLERPDEAIETYQKALNIGPDNAASHNNKGIALQKLGQLVPALASYYRAVELEPDNSSYCNNLGIALKELGRFEDALIYFRKALALKPNFAEAQSNLGTAHHGLGQIIEAMASYTKALELNPSSFDGYNNLGVAQQEVGQLTTAIQNYRRSLEINPNFFEAQNNLGAALGELGKLAEAAECYRRALEMKPDFTRAFSNLLFIHNYLADQPTENLLVEAKRYGSLVASMAKACTNWQTPPDQSRCLRIGIVSGDLRQHPVGYFLDGILQALTSITSGRLEFFAYSNTTKVDILTHSIKASCKGWYSTIGLSDEILAKQIWDDRIDILIDLAGHTAHNRLPVFAWKPAPLQVSWLGYFATTGVAEIDYLLADPWTLPESEEASFTETIWRLPETRLCFSPPKPSVEVNELPAMTNGYVTFGSFNNLTKMNEEVLSLWVRILHAVPNSRLFLKTMQFREPSMQIEVADRFSKHGISRERLILEPYAPRERYLAAYNRVDIALDPFPFTGGTTTVETLWMGVPVLTLAGRQFLARQGVGLLMNAGLPEWVASDKEDYLARAVAHASDLQRLASLRAGLRQQVLASPIFDAPRFARHFETALRGMWEKWCRGQGARSSEQAPTVSSVNVDHVSHVFWNFGQERVIFERKPIVSID